MDLKGSELKYFRNNGGLSACRVREGIPPSCLAGKKSIKVIYDGWRFQGKSEIYEEPVHFLDMAKRLTVCLLAV